MQLALHEAAIAAAEGEVPVGAVVLTAQGHIIGRGHNCSITCGDPCGHAEIAALRAAGNEVGNYRLNGCLMAVTLEPCLMCTGALVHARLAGLVYGAVDMQSGAVESCFNGLDLPFLNHRVWHMGGIARKQCTAMLQKFFRNTRNSQHRAIL